MNEDHRNDIIKYRIERSKETYREAILMNRENHWNACANRLYYSCFYAVTALLQKHDMTSGKHTGVKSFFNQYFVKTNIVSKENGKLYKRGGRTCTKYPAKSFPGFFLGKTAFTNRG